MDFRADEHDIHGVPLQQDVCETAVQVISTMMLFADARFWLVALLFAGLPASAQDRPFVGKIGVGLYGANGHQLTVKKLADHPQARLVAVAAITRMTLPERVKRHESLDQLIADPDVQLISLCSPRRADQGRDAIRCLEGGKHVYAEKPSTLTEVELDQIVAAARRAGREFHEMAGTAFEPNYAAMRRLVRSGAVGDVIQVFVQKSYRYGRRRPQDEAVDGGMFLQAGIHAARLIEHVGAVRIKTITGWETTLGSPEEGDGKTAATAQIGLENGGLATAIINYLNPANPQLPHGNETLRVFGTKGFVESVDGGARTRLVTAANVIEPLELLPKVDYFDAVVAHLVEGAPLPLTSDEELHPLRLMVRAKEEIRAAERRSKAYHTQQGTH